MKSLKSYLRQRRAISRIDIYEQDGINAEKSVTRDFAGLLNGTDIRPKHRPLLRIYEKAMLEKLSRQNSYLTVFLDAESFAFSAWWVWRDAEGQYIGLTRFEFSDQAMAQNHITIKPEDHLATNSPYTRRLAVFQLS